MPVNMPPRWGFASFWVAGYKDVAPPELRNGGLGKTWTAAFIQQPCPDYSFMRTSMPAIRYQRMGSCRKCVGFTRGLLRCRDRRSTWAGGCSIRSDVCLAAHPTDCPIPINNRPRTARALSRPRLRWRPNLIVRLA